MFPGLWRDLAIGMVATPEPILSRDMAPDALPEWVGRALLAHTINKRWPLFPGVVNTVAGSTGWSG